MPGLGLSHVLVPVPAGFGHVKSYFLGYYLLIFVTMHIKCAQKGSGRKRFRQRAYVRWVSLTLLPLTQLHLQQQLWVTGKYRPANGHCCLVMLLSSCSVNIILELETLGSSSTLSRIMFPSMLPWEWTSKGNKKMCLAYLTQTRQYFREELSLLRSELQVW